MLSHVRGVSGRNEMGAGKKASESHALKNTKQDSLQKRFDVLDAHFCWRGKPVMFQAEAASYIKVLLVKCIT